MVDKKDKKTLVINRSDSYCGNCGKGCDPKEKIHIKVLGWTVKKGEKGCGKKWEYVGSDYGGRVALAARDMRLDLIFRKDAFINR